MPEVDTELLDTVWKDDLREPELLSPRSGGDRQSVGAGRRQFEQRRVRFEEGALVDVLADPHLVGVLNAKPSRAGSVNGVFSCGSVWVSM